MGVGKRWEVRIGKKHVLSFELHVYNSLCPLCEVAGARFVRGRAGRGGSVRWRGRREWKGWATSNSS